MERKGWIAMNSLLRSAVPSKRLLLVVLALTSTLVFSASAMAALKGPFKVFAQCPRFTTGVERCLAAEIESGSVTIGSSEVPIKNTITLQGGIETRPTDETEHLVAALNGETLSKTPEPVPGGLAGLIKCNEIKGLGLVEIAARASCSLVFENGVTGVNAVTELARPASEVELSVSNLVNEEGTALKLPIKVRLENPLLGSACYIGSSAEPVTLHLTTGTTSPPEPNKPISGKVGDLTSHVFEGVSYLQILENTLVDNSFSAPAANGCGGIFAFLIDPIIDAKLGLPSASGHNTAIQNGKQFSAAAQNVIKDEKGETE
jgi:hypothetical protein